MKIEHSLSLPPKCGQIVKDYLKVLNVDTEYPAYSLNEKLEIIECKGVISNNESWNYHKDCDDSENELYVVIGKVRTAKWFTLNKEDAVRVQKENIEKWRAILVDELSRLDTITV